MRDFWQPALAAHPRRHIHRPEPGDLIAVNRQPYRVESIRDQPLGDWHDRARDEWAKAGMPDPWSSAPFEVHVREAASGKRRGMIVVQPWFWNWCEALPEHYAVCVHCGQLAPCREVTAERAAEREMAHFEHLTKILPGCCWGCSEPITARQRSVVFPGPNLLLPTAAPSPAFHLRRGCAVDAARYEEQWVRAGEKRPRSLLTLKCRGSLIVHGDGSAECFGAVESACPSVYASHMSYSACFAQSHGCGYGCTREGHPGCRTASAPRDYPLLPENVVRSDAA